MSQLVFENSQLSYSLTSKILAPSYQNLTLLFEKTSKPKIYMLSKWKFTWLVNLFTLLVNFTRLVN